MVFLKGLVVFLLVLSAVVLILVVMVQRGKGGGLAGALGGMGGQSAFGTKAGDLFTRITIGVAAVWIVLSMVAVKLFATGSNILDVGGQAPAPVSAPANPNGGPADAGGPAPAAPGDAAPAAPASAPAEKPAGS